MKLNTGDTALVTGAAGGLGFSLAEALLQRGLRVALTDVNAEGLERAMQKLSTSKSNVLALSLDVRDREAWERAAEKIEASLGPISVLCNNAGISAIGSRVEDMKWEYWDLTMEINLQGVFNGVRTFLPRMLQRGKRAYIVNTASAASLGPTPEGGAAYIASKYAVLGLSESLRRDLAGGPVGVAVICPGPVKTELWQSTRRLRNLPELDSPPAESASRSGSSNAMPPSQVAELVLKTVEADEFFVITHSHYRPVIEQRHAEIMACLERAEQS